MSPEQVRNDALLDQRADVWSLGCVLYDYEMATGSAPFERETPEQHSCRAVLEDQPASIRAERPDIDPRLEQIVLRCLSKRSSERFASARALKHALDQLERYSRVSSMQLRASMPPPAAATHHPSRGRRTWMLVVGTCLGMIVAEPRPAPVKHPSTKRKPTPELPKPPKAALQEPDVGF
jgi:serine/threonine protein kinase